MQKCVHLNAGNLGSILAVCACAYDPVHMTVQGKSILENCADVLTRKPSYECEGPGEQLGVCCFLIGGNGSREKIDVVSNANEARDPKNNSPIVFSAL